MRSKTIASSVAALTAALGRPFSMPGHRQRRRRTRRRRRQMHNLPSPHANPLKMVAAAMGMLAFTAIVLAVGYVIGMHAESQRLAGVHAVRNANRIASVEAERDQAKANLAYYKKQLDQAVRLGDARQENISQLIQDRKALDQKLTSTEQQMEQQTHALQARMQQWGSQQFLSGRNNAHLQVWQYTDWLSGEVASLRTDHPGMTVGQAAVQAVCDSTGPSVADMHWLSYRMRDALSCAIAETYGGVE